MNRSLSYTTSQHEALNHYSGEKALVKGEQKKREKCERGLGRATQPYVLGVCWLVGCFCGIEKYFEKYKQVLGNVFNLFCLFKKEPLTNHLSFISTNRKKKTENEEMGESRKKTTKIFFMAGGRERVLPIFIKVLSFQNLFDFSCSKHEIFRGAFSMTTSAMS